MPAERYAGFPGIGDSADYQFEVDLTPPPALASDEDVRLWWQDGRWNLTRGDFRAIWGPVTRRGPIRQSPKPLFGGHRASHRPHRGAGARGRVPGGRLERH